MLLTTILNHVQKFKRFVFKKVQWANAKKTEIEVLVEARANSRPICSQCGRVVPRHGRQPVRRFSYLPVWGIPVTFVYAPRRDNCSWCGIRLESLPWTLPENLYILLRRKTRRKSAPFRVRRWTRPADRVAPYPDHYSPALCFLRHPLPPQAWAALAGTLSRYSLSGAWWGLPRCMTMTRTGKSPAIDREPSVPAFRVRNGMTGYRVLIPRMMPSIFGMFVLTVLALVCICSTFRSACPPVRVMLAGPFLASRPGTPPNGGGYVVSVASDPAFTRHSWTDRLQPRERLVQLVDAKQST